MVRVVRTTASSRSAGGWLFGMALGVYLFSAGGSLTSTDAVVAFDVTRNILEHGTVATTRDLIGLEAFRGPDGRYYSPFGIAQSIYNVPFYLAGTTFVRMTGITAGKADSIPKASVAVGQTLLVAVIVWQVFSLSLALTGQLIPAGMAAVTAAFGSVLWPYARFGFNQPLAAVTLVAAVAWALRGARQKAPGTIAMAGWALAVSLMTRHEMVLAAIPIGLWLLTSASDWTAGVRRVMAFAPGVLAGVGAWLTFNAVRFGNPFDSGYLRDSVPGFGGSMVDGLFGLLFSPGASLFLYSPCAVFGVVGLGLLWRRDRSAAGLLWSVALVFLLFYATLGNWIGGRSYGSRYLVIVVPFLAAGWAVLLAGLQNRARMLAFAVVTSLSMLVQLPGVLVDYAKVSQAASGSSDGFSTVERQWSWHASSLALNSRALVTAVPDNLSYVAGWRPAPVPTAPAGPDDRSFSQQFAFSLDFWWLYLFYLGLISRTPLALILAAAVLWIALASWQFARALAAPGV